jgi:flagellar biosynthetic protein FlhB
MAEIELKSIQSLFLFAESYHIDLQLFAAEDEGRTEEGSERRRREERDKGNVPKSNELPAALVLISAVVAVFFLSNYIFINSMKLFHKYFDSVFVKQSRFEAEEMSALFRNITSDLFTLLVPVLSITFIVAVAGNVVQVGFLFSTRAVSINFEKIIPNFKRVLPTRQTFYNLFKSLSKILLIAIVSYIIISSDFFPVLMTGQMSLKQALSLVGFSALKIFLISGLLLFAISIMDYYYQKFEFEESIKMTPSEAKQEMKETEGDKTWLNRRRQMVREFVRKGMLQRVPKADVVIVNPTHFSVALSYNPKIHNAPVVIAKGADELALIIRRLARKHNIPLIEDRLQARLLYEEVEVDSEIPAKFFRAVSLIIARLEKYRRAA